MTYSSVNSLAEDPKEDLSYIFHSIFRHSQHYAIKLLSASFLIQKGEPGKLRTAKKHNTNKEVLKTLQTCWILYICFSLILQELIPLRRDENVWSVELTASNTRMKAGLGPVTAPSLLFLVVLRL